MGGRAKDPTEAAAKLQREQLERLAEIELPELEELKVTVPELVGLLETEQLEPSALQDISLDPQLREAQMAALEEMQERGEIGLTPEDRARLSEIRRGTAAQQQAQQKAILQGMAERGQLDSGAQLIAQLQSAGAGATEAQRAGEQLAAQAAASRREALQRAGGMAGQMEQAQYGREAQAAQAQDAIRQFNLRQRANIAAQNLAARQNIEQQRADARSKEQAYRIQIPQQQFQNRMTRAGAQGQAGSALAQTLASQRQGPSAFQTIGTIGGGILGGIYGGPAGASAGATAGGAIGGAFENFEDGGIVKNEADRVRKKKYNNKMYQQDTRPAYEDSGLVLTPGQQARLNSKQTGIYDFSQPMDDGLKKGNAAIYGQDTDRLADQDMTYEQAKQTTNQNQDGFEMGADDIAALRGITKLLGNQQKTKPVKIGVDKGNYQMPKNILGKALQKMEDGGTAYNQDGGILFESTGNGDIVGGDSFERDRVDARLNSGEAVLNVAQQQRLMDILRGEASVQDLGDENIVEGVPANYQEELKNEIDEGKSEQQKKIEGLENLLKALGK